MIFANTATSSVVFAVAVLQAAGATRTAATITGIAIAVNTFSCVLHSASRQWGIRLNNLFGTLKLLMLVIMIIFGIVWNNKSIADTNFDRTTAFSKTPGGVSQFTEALVYAIFSFGGFQQANYVSWSRRTDGSGVPRLPEPTGTRRDQEPPQELCVDLCSCGLRSLHTVHGAQYPLCQYSPANS